ncbi:heat shock protein 70 [Echinococcus multilocularis]|uniref:Heat shock protein 70 n=1 Tax=Echinococcus multilocularis TaxID=6211 RepID=A0A0S4MP85_ECHMU|nr:heat shock protein 70 [Echinococcus multilocularis]
MPCEAAKRMLNWTVLPKVCIELLFEAIDCSAALTMYGFERLYTDLFNRTVDPVKKALSDERLDKANVDETVCGRDLNKSINTGEAVACDAVLLVAEVTGEGSEAAENLMLLEVTSPNTSRCSNSVDRGHNTGVSTGCRGSFADMPGCLVDQLAAMMLMGVVPPWLHLHRHRRATRQAGPVLSGWMSLLSSP